jgi:hypothetical protein
VILARQVQTILIAFLVDLEAVKMLIRYLSMLNFVIGIIGIGAIANSTDQSIDQVVKCEVEKSSFDGDSLQFKVLGSTLLEKSPSLPNQMSVTIEKIGFSVYLNEVKKTLNASISHPATLGEARFSNRVALDSLPQAWSYQIPGYYGSLTYRLKCEAKK